MDDQQFPQHLIDAFQRIAYRLETIDTTLRVLCAHQDRAAEALAEIAAIAKQEVSK